MNSSDNRVATYLDDLARMLSDIDPGERDEVLAGIREHLDAEIGSSDGGDAAVQAALLRLGPPERVAAEARAGHPAGPGAATAVARVTHPTRTRVATAVALALVVWLALWILVTRLAMLPLLYGGSGNEGVEALLPHPSEILLMVPLSPVWLVPLALVLLAPEVSGRPKIWLALSGPAVFVVGLVAGVWFDPLAVTTAVVVIGTLGVLGLAVAIARRVWRETSA
ncbi:MAG TPA: hypothetical protein VFL10_13865 [Ornithinibacter sp.]|nr:hypothetical protein [Ornithinibacter sp.]